MQQTLDRPHRPLGVTIIALILSIHGILDVILGVIILAGALALGHVAATHGHGTTATVVDIAGGVLGGITIAVGLIKLICPVGLFLLKRWAYWLALIIEGFSVVKYGLELARPQNSHIGLVLTVIPLAFAAIVILYLVIDPNVRTAFFNKS